MTMVFHICGICNRDRGRVDLVTIDEDILTRVRRSAMPRLVVQLAAAKDDIIASIGEQAYAAHGQLISYPNLWGIATIPAQPPQNRFIPVNSPQKK